MKVELIKKVIRGIPLKLSYLLSIAYWDIVFVEEQVISLFFLGSYYLFLDNIPVVAVVGLLLYVGCYQVTNE